MLVYRSPRTLLEPRAALAALDRAARRLGASAWAAHDAWIALLVDAGQLESGVADALCPDADDTRDELDALHEVTLACARGERLAWAGAGADALHESTARLHRALAAAHAVALPTAAWVGVPEGYAYYAVYPRGHAHAARHFFRAARPSRVTCIGIRTIGTSLAAAIAVELEALGCDVRAWTVRPRGHPFDRHVCLTPAMARAIGDRSAGHVLVIDEGPGLSGSSFAATADVLASLGFPDERIAFCPSWASDGATLVNARAAARWRRHGRYVVAFDELWSASDRLAHLAGSPTIDFSAGKWRDHLIRHRRDHPAVQPQHEQRKYLAPGSPHPHGVLLKFVGLGRYGRPRLERAERLADAGFAPRPLGLAEGFLRTEFAPGHPVRGPSADEALIDRVADYLTFLRREFATGRAVPFDSIMEMVAVNVAEGLGDEWISYASAADRCCEIVGDTEAVAIDGRMLAHEWIRCGDRYLKTDGLSHHDDHFWPGCQDIAWDLAAAIIELGLGAPAARSLIERYQRRSGDATVGARLPFARVGYLASRLGYVALAATTLGAAPDGGPMRTLRRRYAGLLRRCLVRATGRAQPR